MRKVLLPLLIITVLAQIFVPIYMIWEKYDVLMSGYEVKMDVLPVDPYDSFRGRYVSLRYDYDLDYSQRKGKYGVFEVDNNGFAVLKQVVSEKPDNGLYLISKDDEYFYVPLDRYYMEEKLAPKAEKVLADGAETYVTLRIKGDKAVISGLFINGVPAEELLTE